MTSRQLAPNFASEAAKKMEKRDEDSPCNYPGAFDRPCAGAVGACGRHDAWKGQFRNLLQSGGAEAVQPGHAISAFVLVPCVATNLRGCAESRSGVRHRLLGHRAEPLMESPRRAAREKSR